MFRISSIVHKQIKVKKLYVHDYFRFMTIFDAHVMHVTTTVISYLSDHVACTVNLCIGLVVCTCEI